MAAGISPEEARWKPAPGSWSILEVMNHLLDEERFDFRVRAEYTLNRPGERFPGIDPEGWVTERKYNERDPGATLEEFLAERKKSTGWLRGLSEVDWSTAYAHEMGGRTFSAGDFLASWLAHDMLHMRQLARLHFEYGRTLTAPYSTEYAGSW